MNANKSKSTLYDEQCVCVRNVHVNCGKEEKEEEKKGGGRKWSTLSEQGICECKINDEISNALWITQKKIIKTWSILQAWGTRRRFLSYWDFCSWFPPRLSQFYSSNHVVYMNPQLFHRKLHSILPIFSNKSNFSSSHPLFIHFTHA